MDAGEPTHTLERPTWPAVVLCAACAADRDGAAERCPHCGTYSAELLPARADLATAEG